MPRSKLQRWYDGLSEDNRNLVLGLGFVIVILIVVAFLANPIVSFTMLVLTVSLGFTVYTKYKTGKWWFRTYPAGERPARPSEELPEMASTKRLHLSTPKEPIGSILEPTSQSSPASLNPTKSLSQSFNQLGLDEQVDRLVRAIQSFIPPRNPPKEWAYHDMLVSNLMRDYPEIKLHQQFGNNEIDAVVGRIGIEAKLWLRKQEADRLFGQIDAFLQHLDRVIVVLYQPNPERQNYLKQKLARHGWLDTSVRVIVV